MSRHMDAWEGFPFGVCEGSAGQVDASVDDVQGDHVALCGYTVVTSEGKGSVVDLHAAIHHLEARVYRSDRRARSLTRVVVKYKNNRSCLSPHDRPKTA